MPPAPREPCQCRPCSACCVWLPIPADVVGPGAKPAGISCPHLCKTGCKIYGQRPETCNNFACVWFVDESWPAAWRPDRSGLLCLREQIEGHSAAAVYEIRNDALQTPLATEMVNELRRTTAVFVLVDLHQRRRCLPGRRIDDAQQQIIPVPHSQRLFRPEPLTRAETR